LAGSNGKLGSAEFLKCTSISKIVVHEKEKYNFLQYQKINM